MTKVLITGGNGLIGSRLQTLLLDKGYGVNIIGRTAHVSTDPRVRFFTWNVAAGSIDTSAFDGVSVIIHLAGAGVADKRWTALRKMEIYDSRIDSTRLIYNALATVTHQVKTIVSASAVGYYGDCGAEVLTETHEPGSSFLAKVTDGWETEVARMETLGIRHACCRIGIVLSRLGGALPALERTIPLGIAGYFSKPDLYYSWIHIDDVCGIMIHALEKDNMKSSYNTTAPGPIPIKELMRAIVQAKGSKAILTPVPPFALKIALGEMSEAVLNSQRCSNRKIMEAGYTFTFPDLKGALEEIYSK
ncbi:MAG: hypothetical protein JWO03_3405 [Bacteroidetes bacterium]|nr:hypothetical protein [Bacteroidota bacterium]